MSRRLMCHRRGAALIMALFLLTVLLLLGVPFLLSQKTSYAGAHTFDKGLQAEVHRSNAEALGIELAHRLAMAQHLRAATVAYSAPAPDINDTLFPGWQTDATITGLAYTTYDTGEVHIDLPAIYRVDDATGELVRWPGSSYNIDMAEGSRISIEDLSGRVDINGLNTAQWDALLKLAGIVDWDDGNGNFSNGGDTSRLDSRDDENTRHRPPTPYQDDDDGDDLGELAEALSRHRYSYPEECYTTVEQLLDADPGHNDTDPGQTYQYPVGSQSFGFRPPLTEVELERLKPLILVNGLAQAKQSQIEIGTITGFGLDYNEVLQDRLEQDYEVPVLHPNDDVRLTNHGAASPELADPWNDDIGDDYYSYRPNDPTDPYAIQRPGPAQPTRSDGGDPYTLHELTPAVVAQIGQPINLNLAQSPPPDDTTVSAGDPIPGANVAGDINAYTQSLFLRHRQHTTSDGGGAYAPRYSHLQTMADLFAAYDWRFARPAPSLASSYLYRIHTSGSSVNVAGEAMGQRRRTIYAQVPPQGVDLERQWNSQATMQWHLDQRFGNLLTTGPSPVARLTMRNLQSNVDGSPDDDNPRDALSTTSGNDEQFRPIPLLDPSYGLGSGGSDKPLTLTDPSWYHRYRGNRLQEDLDANVATAPTTIDDLRVDGMRVTTGAHIAYEANGGTSPLGTIDPVPDPIQANSRLRPQPMEPLHIAFSFRPEASAWTDEVILFDSRAPDANHGLRYAPGSWLNYQNGATGVDYREADMNDAGDAFQQHRITISYDCTTSFFKVVVADGTIGSSSDYGPLATPFSRAPLGGNQPLTHYYYYPLPSDDLWTSHLSCEIRSYGIGGITLMVNGLAGRDLNQADLIRSMNGGGATLRPGDHVTWPCPAVLDQDLPEILVNAEYPLSDWQDSDGNGVLSDDFYRYTNPGGSPLQGIDITILTLPAGLGLPVDPAGWLPGGDTAAPRSGCIRIGREFISFTNWSASGSSITLLGCARARRQLPDDDGVGLSNVYAPAHSIDDQVVAGGFSLSVRSLVLQRGGARMLDTLAGNPQTTTSGTVASGAATMGLFDGSVLAVKAHVRIEGDFTRTDGTTGNASGIYLIDNQDGDGIADIVDEPVLPANFQHWNSGATVAQISLRLSIPSGCDPSAPNGFYHNSGMIQLIDQTGNIEWIAYDDLLYDAAIDPDALYCMGSDLTSANRRGQKGTSTLTFSTTNLPANPVQTRSEALTAIEAGDRLTLVPALLADGTAIYPPFQVCVTRHVYDSGDTAGNLRWYFAFAEALPATFGAIDRILCWPAINSDNGSEIEQRALNDHRYHVGDDRLPWANAFAPGFASDDDSGPEARQIWIGATDQRRAASAAGDFTGLVDDIAIGRANHGSIRVSTNDIWEQTATGATEVTGGLAADSSDGLASTTIRLSSSHNFGRSGFFAIGGEVVAWIASDLPNPDPSRYDDTDYTFDLDPGGNQIPDDSDPTGFQTTPVTGNDWDGRTRIRIVGRGLFGSEPTVIRNGMRIHPLPLPAVNRLAPYYDGAVEPELGYGRWTSDADKGVDDGATLFGQSNRFHYALDANFHWLIQVDDNGETDIDEAPAFLLLRPDGTGHEAVQLIAHNGRLCVAPWLRGLYNTDLLDGGIISPMHANDPNAGGAYNPALVPSTLIMPYYPRYAPVLPNSRPVDAEGVEDQRLYRSRSFAWAGFPIRYHRARFDDVDADILRIEADDTNPDNAFFQAEVRALHRGYNWVSTPDGDVDAVIRSATTMGAFNDAFDHIGDNETDGVEARVFWRYPRSFSDQRADFGSGNDAVDAWLAMVRNAGRAPSIGPVTIRCRAPIVIFSSEEDH